MKSQSLSKRRFTRRRPPSIASLKNLIADRKRLRQRIGVAAAMGLSLGLLLVLAFE